jgi:hypothetical protein
MSEKDWLELNAAISGRSLEKASLRTLMRYDRALRERPVHEVSPAIRDQLRSKITQKVITIAAGTLVITSIVGGMAILLQRVLGVG